MLPAPTAAGGRAATTVPAGAITVLLPVYLSFLGLPSPPATLTAFYTLLIAFLMVSRLPVFSGKTVRMRVPPEIGKGAVRLSVGRFTTEEEIDRAADALLRAASFCR